MMVLETKFGKPNMQFASSRIRVAPEAKFRKSNLHFTSSKTEFKDPWCILLKKNIP